MPFIYVSDGIDDVLAQHLNQYADAWTGVSGKGVPFNAVAVNDPINFAISARNLDATNSRVQQLLKADGTVLLQVDAAGVKASPDGVTGAATVVTTTATQTLTNKTLTSPSISYVAGGISTVALAANAVTQLWHAVMTGNLAVTVATDIASLPITTTGGDLVLFACGPGHAVTAAGALWFDLDGAGTVNLANLAAGGQANLPWMFVYRYIAPAAGAHTVKLRGSCTGGTMTLNFAGAANGMFLVAEIKR